MPRQRKAFSSDAVRELGLYIENDGELYRRQTEPIEKNLLLKAKRGKYDPKKAPKLKSLAKQVWGPGTKMILHDYEWPARSLTQKQRPGRKKKMTWANMLGPYGDKL